MSAIRCVKQRHVNGDEASYRTTTAGKTSVRLRENEAGEEISDGAGGRETS